MPQHNWEVISDYAIEVDGIIVSAQHKGHDKNGNPRYEITRTFKQYGSVMVAKLSRMITSYNIQEDIKKYIAL